MANGNKKHYEILVEGDGRGNYPTTYIDVYCTEENLRIIASALVSYVNKFTDGGCCCIAKENGGVSNNNFDILFSDCM